MPNVCLYFFSHFPPGHPLHAAAMADLDRMDRERRSLEQHAQQSEAMRLHSIAAAAAANSAAGGASGPTSAHPPSSRMSPFGPPHSAPGMNSLKCISMQLTLEKWCICCLKAHTKSNLFLFRPCICFPAYTLTRGCSSPHSTKRWTSSWRSIRTSGIPIQ